MIDINADRGSRLMGQLEQTVGLVGNVVGPEFVGTYLHGSSVLGGLCRQ
ncbi:hypothetical protein ACJ6WF_40235 [Streptomyces sp. MMS24-I2-30]